MVVVINIGHPYEDIWEKALEGSLHPIRYDLSDEKVKLAQPGVFATVQQKLGSVYFIDFDLTVAPSNMAAVRTLLDELAKSVSANYLLVIPINLEYSLRVSICYIATPTKLAPLQHACTSFAARLIYFGKVDTHFDISIEQLDGNKAKEQSQLAGYPLHPKYAELIVNETINYTV